MSLPGYDSWLAGHRHHETEAYCSNPQCVNHHGVAVTYVTEYGQSWYEPEECWRCGGEWLEDAPSDDEDDDDDDEDDHHPSDSDKALYWVGYFRATLRLVINAVEAEWLDDESARKEAGDAARWALDAYQASPLAAFLRRDPPSDEEV